MIVEIDGADDGFRKAMLKLEAEDQQEAFSLGMSYGKLAAAGIEAYGGCRSSISGKAFLRIVVNKISKEATP